MSRWAEQEGYNRYLEPGIQGSTEVDWSTPRHGARSWRRSWPPPTGWRELPAVGRSRTDPGRQGVQTTPQPVLHQTGFPHRPGGRPLHLSGRRGHAPSPPPGAQPRRIRAAGSVPGHVSSRGQSVTPVPCNRSVCRPHRARAPRRPASPGRSAAGGPGLAGQRRACTLSGLAPGGRTSPGPSGAVGPAPGALSGACQDRSSTPADGHRGSSPPHGPRFLPEGPGAQGWARACRTTSGVPGRSPPSIRNGRAVPATIYLQQWFVRTQPAPHIRLCARFR